MPQIGYKPVRNAVKQTASPIVHPPGSPYWQTTDGRTCRLHLGNVVDVLKALPPKSVHCVVTSPPYWGLRDYGVDKRLEIGSEAVADCGIAGSANCGECYVCRMRSVFREVRRVLRDDGTCWLNMGDTYAGGAGGRGDADIPSGAQLIRGERGVNPKNAALVGKGRIRREGGLPSGNLVGVPWRLALALQQDGWVLRQDIVWAKPSPMPESVSNRCTKAHEYVFLLTKTASGYYCDMEAIKTLSQEPGRTRSASAKYASPTALKGRKASGNQGNVEPMTDAVSSNKRTVWEIEDHTALVEWLSETNPALLAQFFREGPTADVWRIATRGYPGAHFATFPQALIEPMILAGTSEKGCCAACGAPWNRMTETETVYRDRPNTHVKYVNQGPNGQPDQRKAGSSVKTIDWQPSCECGDNWEEEEPPGILPCIVLDPFVGSGTACAVSIANGRHAIGIDLSEPYLGRNAIPRVEGVLLSRPSLRPLIPSRRMKAVEGLPGEMPLG